MHVSNPKTTHVLYVRLTYLLHIQVIAGDFNSDKNIVKVFLLFGHVRKEEFHY